MNLGLEVLSLDLLFSQALLGKLVLDAEFAVELLELELIVF